MTGTPFVAYKVERGACIGDDAFGVFRLGRHRRHVHIEVTAVHIDGDNRRFAGVELELVIQPVHQARSIDDLDLTHHRQQSVRGILRCVRLLTGERAVERLYLHALSEHAHDDRYATTRRN